MNGSSGGIAAAATRGRRRVLIVCAHEPELDPRIDWVARFAPGTMSPTVLGFHDPARPRPAEEMADGIYRVVRVSRWRYSLLRSTAILAHATFTSAPWRNRVAVGAALAAVIPAGIVYELGVVVAGLVTGIYAGMSRMASIVHNRSLVSRAVAAAARALRARMSDRRPVGSAKEASAHGVPRPAIPVSRSARLRVFQTVLAYFVRTNAALVAAGREGEPFDVVHANDLETLPAGVLLKWLTGARLVYDAHEYWPYSDVHALELESGFWRHLEGRLVRHVDAAFTVSDPLARELSRLYGRPFASLPNCEPNRDFPPSAASDRDVAHRPVRFLYQGNFAPERGLEELLMAWALIAEPSAELYLRGPGSPSRDACRQLAEKLGLTAPRVQFLEPVRENELVDAAVAFDVGVIPYKPDALAYRFACPNKLSQYMQAGLAIFSNDLPYVGELLHTYRCGTVYDTKDIPAVARAIDTIVSDLDALAGMKRRSRAAATADFNWQRKSGPLYAAYSPPSSG